jgi:hypothetical protein
MRALDRRHAVLLAVVATGAAACSNASSDPGLNALLRVAGTGSCSPSAGQPSCVQYVPGELTTEAAADSPIVRGISVTTNIVFPGVADRPLSGSARESSAVLIGLPGDIGHWIAPTGIRDTDVTDEVDYIFQTRFSLSPLLPLDPPDRTLVFRAVDAAGQVGPPLSLPIKVIAQTSPIGVSLEGQPLVVSLVWDAEADLDLKVRMPNPLFDPADPKSQPTIDIWTKHRVALPVRGNSELPYTEDEVKDVGQLDYDSNANCVLDGLLQENLIFTQAPPSPKAAPPGTYEVRVDAASLCGQATARWHAYAIANGTDVRGEAYGQAIDIDTQGSHGPATGTLAFTFMVP